MFQNCSKEELKLSSGTGILRFLGGNVVSSESVQYRNCVGISARPTVPQTKNYVDDTIQGNKTSYIDLTLMMGSKQRTSCPF